MKDDYKVLDTTETTETVEDVEAPNEDDRTDLNSDDGSDGLKDSLDDNQDTLDASNDFKDADDSHYEVSDDQKELVNDDEDSLRDTLDNPLSNNDWQGYELKNAETGDTRIVDSNNIQKYGETLNELNNISDPNVNQIECGGRYYSRESLNPNDLDNQEMGSFLKSQKGNDGYGYIGYTDGNNSQIYDMKSLKRYDDNGNRVDPYLNYFTINGDNKTLEFGTCSLEDAVGNLYKNGHCDYYSLNRTKELEKTLDRSM